MKQAISIFFGLLVMMGMVTALTDTFKHVDARYSGGKIIVSGSYYTNLEPGTIRAFCRHDTTNILVGEHNYTDLSNSADGRVTSFYITSENTGCIKGDLAWVESRGIISNTTIHKHSHTNIPYNSEEPSGVPEFGPVALVIAAIGTMLGIVYLRRD